MDNLILISSEDDGIRLDRLIRRQIPTLKQSQLEKLLRIGKIRVDAKKVKAGIRLQSGQEIEFKFDLNKYLSEEVSPKINASKLIISDASKRKALSLLESWKIEETSEWIAVNKPVGIAVQGGSKVNYHLDRLLKEGFGDSRPRLVHRIDKDTSGVLLLAKTQKSARLLTQYFRDQLIKKTYLAFCMGKIGQSGKISEPVAKSLKKGIEKMMVDREFGQTSISLFERIFYNNGISLVCLRPVTGRTHQLRVHMNFIGTPILGDGKYNSNKTYSSSNFAKKLHLHSHFMTLPSGQLIKARVPEHMQLAASIIGANIPTQNQYFIKD